MPPTADAPDKQLQPVPLAFLAQPDDKEQMQTPAKGDTGTMTVDYTVVDVQGDNAIIQPTAINGNDLAAEEAGEDPNAADEQEGAALQGMASQMDNQP